MPGLDATPGFEMGKLKNSLISGSSLTISVGAGDGSLLCSVDPVSDENFKEKLIRNVKKEVKQIMEEAVTRKFVHEESSSITSLCGKYTHIIYIHGSNWKLIQISDCNNIILFINYNV